MIKKKIEHKMYLFTSPSSFQIKADYLLSLFFAVPELRSKRINLKNNWIRRMNMAASRALIVAGSVGIVEALKDQGFARWNYTLRSIHQHTKSNLRSVSQAKKLSSPSMAPKIIEQEKEKLKRQQSEESLRKVMYLSCWGPNWPSEIA